MARAKQTESAVADAGGELVCPECGKTFIRAAALGSHRRRAHGVAGGSSRSKPSKRRKGAIVAANDGRRRTAASREPASTAATPEARTRSRGNPARRSSSVDRDALLQTLFPNGIPAREEVIRSVNSWLDEAERLARGR